MWIIDNNKHVNNWLTSWVKSGVPGTQNFGMNSSVTTIADNTLFILVKPTKTTKIMYISKHVIAKYGQQIWLNQLKWTEVESTSSYH